MKKFTKMFVGVFCALLIVTATSFAADAKATNATPVAVETVKAPEAWTLSLGGNGATDTTGAKSTAFGLDLGLGRTGHLLLPLEAGVRQTIAYSQPNVIASTKLYADWTLLKVSKLDLFAGANAGAAYGNTKLSWSGAPEAGVRLWLKKDVALEARVEAPFNLNESRYTDSITYAVGFKIKF